MYRPKIVIVFLGNINYDSRSRNLFISLNKEGFETSFIGFDWLTKDFSSILQQNIDVKKLSKKYSIIFYLRFVLLLMFKLMRTNANIFFAEDIYTLPFVVLAAKFKNAKVIYDSRELYGFLAGLSNKKNIQSILKTIEKIFIKRVDLVITTGEMDRQYLTDEYNLDNVLVVRNLPLFDQPEERVDFYNLLNINTNYKILLYQGVVLHGRGLKILIDVIHKSSDFVLVVIGDGEHLNFYKSLADKHNLNDKIFFLGKIENQELPKYTSGGFIGTSLVENISLSYYYALPNKLFEYIMCGVPALVSQMPQMQQVIEKYGVGRAVDISDADKIISTLNEMKNDDKYEIMVGNCKKASKELNWEIEVQVLIQTIKNWNEN